MENINMKWIPENIKNTWRVSAGPNGWTSHKHAMDWLRRVFEPETREKAGGKPRILICDGHDRMLSGWGHMSMQEKGHFQ